MRWLFIVVVFLVSATPALAWESLTAHAGVSVTVSPGHGPHMGLEVGASYAAGLNVYSPSAGVRARVLFDRRGPVLPQLVAAAGVTAGQLTPLVSVQGEGGVVLVNGRARPVYGLSGWSAPLETVSPRLGVTWSRFKENGEAQDLFQGSLSIALVAPTYVMWLATPECFDECD